MSSVRTRPTTLLGEALPRFDFRSRHSRNVAATPEAVWQALKRYDLSRDASLLMRLLLRFRGLPVPAGSLRAALRPVGFTILAEDAGSEIVAGTFGRFWALRELSNMANPPDLDGFRAFDCPGWAKAAVSLRLEPLADGSTNLVTETRVQCLDDGARRRFAVYWAVIGVFSGWIRRDMLEGIARHAEKEAER